MDLKYFRDRAKRACGWQRNSGGIIRAAFISWTKQNLQRRAVNLETQRAARASAAATAAQEGIGRLPCTGRRLRREVFATRPFAPKEWRRGSPPDYDAVRP